MKLALYSAVVTATFVGVAATAPAVEGALLLAYVLLLAAPALVHLHQGH